MKADATQCRPPRPITAQANRVVMTTVDVLACICDVDGGCWWCWERRRRLLVVILAGLAAVCTKNATVSTCKPK